MAVVLHSRFTARTFPTKENDSGTTAPWVSLVGKQGDRLMESAEELRVQARKCRARAAGITDDDTRNSLELLGRDYDKQADEMDAEEKMSPKGVAKPE
jgi:hypothetical protein